MIELKTYHEESTLPKEITFVLLNRIEDSLIEAYIFENIYDVDDVDRVLKINLGEELYQEYIRLIADKNREVDLKELKRDIQVVTEVVINKLDKWSQVLP